MTIDDLLNRPLEAVPDNGFSARVVERIRAEERRETALSFAAVLVAVAACALVLPLPALSLELGHAVFDIANQTAIGLAAGLLILTYMFERVVARG